MLAAGNTVTETSKPRRSDHPADSEQEDSDSPLRRALVLNLWRVGVGLTLTALAALGWTSFGWEASLNVALVIMGPFIICVTIGALVWDWPSIVKHSSPSASEADQADDTRIEAYPPNPFADAAKVLITTQGIVLGLITFAGPSTLDVTLKVGLASLAGGVLIATTLYSLVAGQGPGDPRRGVAASVLFVLSLWALAFGLICVVAGNW